MTYISTNKTLLFKDELNQRDELGNRVALRGDLTMMDDGGRVVFRNKPNLIVLRGRLFAMEKIFNRPGSSTAQNAVSGRDTYNPYTNILLTNITDKKIWGFCVGRGGSDGVKGGTPAVVNARMHYQIPFRRIIDGNGADSASTETAQTSPPASDRPNYGGTTGQAFTGIDGDTDQGATTRFAESVGSTPARKAYFYKKFDFIQANGGWSISTNGSEVYIEMEMSIGKFDCRVTPTAAFSNTTNLFNELGLVIAKETATANTVTSLSEVELITHLVFDNEPLHNDKSLTMKYRIYA